MKILHLSPASESALVGLGEQYLESVNALVAPTDADPQIAWSHNVSSAFAGLAFAAATHPEHGHVALKTIAANIGLMIGAAPGDPLDRAVALRAFLETVHSAYTQAAAIHETVGSC